MDEITKVRTKGRPWLSWLTVLAAAYALKRFYSHASAADLGWILAPTARAVGWLRGETLTLDPGRGWVATDGSYFIAPACAGVNFMIVALTVSVLGFSHRLGSPGRRLGWWVGSAVGAWAVTIAVNTVRILAAVPLYRLGPLPGLDPGQAHRLLGTVIYVGALWGLFGALDGLTGGRRSGFQGAWLVAGLYLGMTVVTPLLNGRFHPSHGYAGHAMMVSLVTMTALGLPWLARRLARSREKS